MHRNIKKLVHVDDGAKPPGVEVAGIGEDENGTREFFADSDERRAHLKSRGREYVLEPESLAAREISRKKRKNIVVFFCFFPEKQCHKIIQRLKRIFQIPSGYRGRRKARRAPPCLGGRILRRMTLALQSPCQRPDRAG